MRRYTLTWTEIVNSGDQDGSRCKRADIKRIAVEAYGRCLNRLNDQDKAWDIAVRDEAGDDVTHLFACFQD